MIRRNPDIFAVMLIVSLLAAGQGMMWLRGAGPASREVRALQLRPLHIKMLSTEDRLDCIVDKVLEQNVNRLSRVIERQGAVADRIGRQAELVGRRIEAHSRILEQRLNDHDQRLSKKFERLDKVFE